MKVKNNHIEPSILLRYSDFNFKHSSDLLSLVYRFSRIELIYFSLEIIYNRSLACGYNSFAKRIMPIDNGNSIINFIDTHIGKEKVDFAQHHLVCQQTGLEILKYLFSIPNTHSPIDYASIENGSIQKSVDILFMVLLINERIVKGQANITERDSAEDTLANVAICTLENSDFLNFDLLNTPSIHLYKATKFFQFCKTNDFFKQYEKELFEKLGCSDAKGYLYTISKIFVENYNGGSKCCRLVFTKEIPAPKIFEVLSHSINDSIELEKNDDYKAFRAKPLIKLNEFNYVVICVPFLINRLYNSIIFEYTYLSGNGNKVREIISTDFTEKHLLFPICKDIIAPNSPINLSGEECANIESNRAPDFYARNWNDIFLVELKDYSIRAEIKSNPSQDAIYNFLYNKFVTKKKGKDGAIKQLVHNIGAIIKNDFIWDKTIKKPRNIFPILVLGSSAFLTLGVSHILNKFFHEELKKQSIVHKSIKDLIVIDIDTLLLYQDFFSKKKNSFSSIMNEYLEFIHNKHKKSSNISLRLFGHLQTFPEYLKHHYPISSEHLLDKLSKEDIWIN